jgi:hypothetical protein
MKKLLSLVLVTGLFFTLAFGTVDACEAKKCDGTQKKERTTDSKSDKAEHKSAECKAKCEADSKKEGTTEKSSAKKEKKARKDAR